MVAEAACGGILTTVTPHALAFPTLALTPRVCRRRTLYPAPNAFVVMQMADDDGVWQDREIRFDIPLRCVCTACDLHARDL